MIPRQPSDVSPNVERDISLVGVHDEQVSSALRMLAPGIGTIHFTAEEQRKRA